MQLVRQYCCKTSLIVMLRVLPPTKKPCNFICCKTGSRVGGKTRNITIQPVLQQYCKTSCTFFVARFSSFSSVKSSTRRQCYHWCITVVNFIYVTESFIWISCWTFIPSSNVRVDTSSLDILIPLSVTLDTLTVYFVNFLRPMICNCLTVLFTTTVVIWLLPSSL